MILSAGGEECIVEFFLRAFNGLGENSATTAKRS